MALRSRSYLKTRFETGDKPTAADFADIVDTCHNKTVEPYSIATAIGVWNMDSTASVDVTPDPAYFTSHPLAFTVMIRSDLGVWLPYGPTAATDFIQVSYAESTGKFTLSRTGGGAFDTSVFDSGSANRGYIVSYHVDAPA